MKGLLRKWLGLRDIYYIQGEAPEISKPKNAERSVMLCVSNAGITGGDVISVQGVSYMVINTMLEVMPLDPKYTLEGSKVREIV